jgi:flavin-dependent dehydrogenase
VTGLDADVLVAGAGPVGLSAALLAARAGMAVTVLEPRAFPIDKACGEGLMPGAVRDLAALEVRPAGRPFTGIGYLSAGRRAVAALPEPGLGVRRTTLHDALAAAVDRAGVAVVGRAARDVRQDENGVVVDGLRARYLIAADGLHSPVARSLGLDRPADGRRRWGLRAHFAVPPWSDLVEVHWSAAGEAYLTPLADDLVGVAVLSARQQTWSLADFPSLHERLRGADPVAPVRGAGPLRRRVLSPVAGRVLLVGDAAGYVDALTGEGIAVGLRSAREAVRCIVSGRPQDYAAGWRRATRGYRAITATLLAATRPPAARRALVPAAQWFPDVFAAAVRRLAR